MGTIIDLHIEAHNSKQLMLDVRVLFDTYNQMFSANNNTSDLMKINNAAGLQSVKVDPELFNLIKIGVTHSKADASFMNIAIGPLVQLWRIGFDDATIPSLTDINHALSLCDIHKVVLDEKQSTVYLMEHGMKLDLGSIAKGYIADKIMNYLISNRVFSALINIGGNVLVHGPNPNRSTNEWRIGIVDPKDSKAHKIVVPIENKSIVTSGIYERVHKGYHHIFDQNTGYPIDNDLASISVISKHSIDCEIWTTRLFGFNSNEILDKVKNIDHIEVYIVRKDGTTVSSLKERSI